MKIIDIVKRLPQGQKLYTTSHGICQFDEIIDNMIACKLPDGTHIKLYDDGSIHPDGECVLFPSKEVRDWHKYQSVCVNFERIAMNVEE